MLQSTRLLQGLIKQSEIELSCDISTGQYQSSSDLLKYHEFTEIYMAIPFSYTAISGKVVRKNVHATIPKGNMGYFQYSVPGSVAVEPTFLAFL